MGDQREARLRQLAAKQHSAFTRSQALTLGFSASEIQHRRSRGEWVDLGRGVLGVGGSAETWDRKAMATVLAAGDDAAASLGAAAYLHGLIDRAPPTVDVTVPHERRPRKGVHRARNFARRDVKLRRNIPTTCVSRTIIDLAGSFTEQRFEDVLDRALVKGLITIASLRTYIVSRDLGTVRGVRMLNRLLDDREKGVPESELERLFERVLKRFGIKLPDRQFAVDDRRIDFVYHAEKVVIEVDGRRDRSTKQRFDDDRARRNEISLAMPDYLPLQFTWGHLKQNAEWVAETVKRALYR